MVATDEPVAAVLAVRAETTEVGTDDVLVAVLSPRSVAVLVHPTASAITAARVTAVRILIFIGTVRD